MRSAILLATCFLCTIWHSSCINTIFCNYDGTRMNIPSKRSHYRECRNGILEQIPCPPGFVYCKELFSCQLECEGDDIDVVELDPKPVLYEYCWGDDDLTIHPLVDSCSGFIKCIDQSPLIGYCENNYRFDFFTESCTDSLCPDLYE
ncbi:unnamed protein product [Hermetia illucens]|uniref:Chitin-binding type-2 domain-containing protein n=1 Tax=Hermetia illucens TaxID=343691 RepID=A0A7R8YQG2_HERIL|nr:uncharacterized protein LOC119649192 isoform X1 [Hermetia illucens]CAD7080445.1 unnamed protein product [Hermetia illucens]